MKPKRGGLAIAVVVVLAACGTSQTPAPIAPPVVCATPALKAASAGDVRADAAGRGQVFEQIELPGLTDVRIAQGTGGVATADLNGDGLPDLFAVSEQAPFPEALRLHINLGCWEFEPQPVTLLNAEGLPEANHGIPVFADFNGDGLLDFYLTGDPAMTVPGQGRPHPCLLFLARDDYRTFEEVGRAMGADCAAGTTYARQAQIVDVDGDGWLDIGVGADQIGGLAFRPGLPWQHLYRYRPAEGSSRFEDGRFEDIGGTDLVPSFGGKPNHRPDHDLSSPSILLRDLDEDGDIDLVQSYHIDMVLTPWFDAEGNDERRHGVFVWKNQLADTGTFRFERELPGTGGLAEEGWSTYNAITQDYEPVQHAMSHPYIFAADVDNDDDPDILTLGSTDLYWHIHTDQIAAKFWRNERQAGFRAATEEAGLESLNWLYGQWFEFWDAPPLSGFEAQLQVSCLLSSNQRPQCLQQSLAESHFYFADAVFADFDNDGALDLLVVDRHEFDSGYGNFRNVLLMNRGDGRFEPTPTTFSGIDENGIAAEAADLNGDGLLDLYVMKDITNTAPAANGRSVPESEFTDSAYWNTGAHGARENHWVIVRPAGLPHGQLIGAKLRLFDRQGRLVGRRDLFPSTSYKTSGHIESHFGLGSLTDPVLEIELPHGRRLRVDRIPVDALVEVDVNDGTTRVLRGKTTQRDDAQGSGR
ncbi:FG-GAP repeat domain-containing protein [Sinimarinibacterium flocculans]|uniref:FG-GAP repeat domain-containing protein n=1 Tax=Sinimarinibacterium flocculans TaxID=985250 RepID=UPI003516E4ED